MIGPTSRKPGSQTAFLQPPRERGFSLDYDKRMNIPNVSEAERLLDEAEAKNPGGWADHARYVARAARNIAEVHPDLDGETAYILGLLHDIGRQEGVTDLLHILYGYTFLESLGYSDAARICLTHSFPLQDIETATGNWDGSSEELAFVGTYLNGLEYDDYDRLLQLSDVLGWPSGFVLIEKRLLDVALRRGINPMTVEKWRAFLELQNYFEKAIGRSIYGVLPGVVENTFGFTP